MPPALGLLDLVLFNLVAVINIGLLPVVAGYGRISLGLWGVAFLLFFIPEAVAVLTLSASLPGEGGLYLWTLQRFGPFHGFLAGWSYWFANVFYVPMQLIYLSGLLTYAIARPEKVGDKTLVAAVALSWITVTTIANLFGLKVGKWLSNIGAVGIAAAVLCVVLTGQWAAMTGRSLPAPWLAVSPWDALAGLPLMCFSFQGVELASTMGDEIDAAQRNLPRALLITGVVALIVYSAVTASLMALLPVSQISAVDGIMQGIAQGSTRLGLTWVVVPLAAVLFVATAGSLAAWYTGCSRMLLFAGVCNSLPPILGRVHARWNSPHVALLLQGGLSVALILGALFHSTVADAYQVLYKAAAVVSLFPFLYLFAVLLSLRSAKRWQGLLGISGLLISLASIGLAFHPPPQTVDTWLFQKKLLLGVAAPVVLGILLYGSRSGARANAPTEHP